MKVQKVSLGALKKTKAAELRRQKRQQEEERLSEFIKSVARSTLSDVRIRTQVNRFNSDSFTITEYVQIMKSEMSRREGVWAPWVKL